MSESKDLTAVFVVNREIMDISNKYAILIGINNYVDESINNLKYSVNDINEFYNILIDSDLGNFKSENINLLTDDSESKPTRNNIISKLNIISRTAQTTDILLFYFSGHGYVVNNKPYFLCSDTFRNSLDQTAISIEYIKNVLKESLARVKILILDSCHSGSIRGVKDSGIMTRELFNSVFPPPEGFVVMASCKLNEVSFEWGEVEHGVFSYYLLEGLRGGAYRSDDSIITVSDAHQYTSSKVKQWAFPKGLEQNPTLEQAVTGAIPLVSLRKESVITTSGIEFDPINVTLRSEAFLGSWIRDKHTKSLLGSLLNYYAPDEIRKVSDNKYAIPEGIIENVRSDKHYVDIIFNINKNNRNECEEIINYLSETYYWTEITYKINKILDINRLVIKCNNNNFKIHSYEPDEGKEKLEALTPAWKDTITLFKNETDHLEITISPKKDKVLDKLFYESLNIDNIMIFISDITK